MFLVQAAAATPVLPNGRGKPSDLVRCVRDDLLNANRVERFQTLQRETFARCLSDPRDEVLSNDDWLKSDWSD